MELKGMKEVGNLPSLGETKAVDWELKGEGSSTFMAKPIWNTVPQAEFLSHSSGCGIEVAEAHSSNATDLVDSYQDLVDFLEQIFLHSLCDLKIIFGGETVLLI